jgi:glutamate--cysteine ligase
MFLLYCLFSGDEPISEEERGIASENRQRVVLEGRRPGLELNIDGRAMDFSRAALQLLDGLSDIAALMDSVCGGNDYRATLDTQRERVRNPALTPSARILEAMERDFESFFAFAMHQAEEHERYFKDWVIDDETERHYREEAKASLARQAEIEASDTMSFDAFLADYFQRQNAD